MSGNEEEAPPPPYVEDKMEEEKEEAETEDKQDPPQQGPLPGDTQEALEKRKTKLGDTLHNAEPNWPAV